MACNILWGCCAALADVFTSAADRNETEILHSRVCCFPIFTLKSTVNPPPFGAVQLAEIRGWSRLWIVDNPSPPIYCRTKPPEICNSFPRRAGYLLIGSVPGSLQGKRDDWSLKVYEVCYPAFTLIPIGALRTPSRSEMGDPGCPMTLTACTTSYS